MLKVFWIITCRKRWPEISGPGCHPAPSEKSCKHSCPWGGKPSTIIPIWCTNVKVPGSGPGHYQGHRQSWKTSFSVSSVNRFQGPWWATSDTVWLWEPYLEALSSFLVARFSDRPGWSFLYLSQFCFHFPLQLLFYLWASENVKTWTLLLVHDNGNRITNGKWQESQNNRMCSQDETKVAINTHVSSYLCF